MAKRTLKKRLAEYSTNEHVRLQAGGLTLLGGVLWVINGPSSLLLVVLVGIIWTTMQTPHTVALGQLLYAIWVAETSIPGVFGIVSFGILFVPNLFDQWQRETALTATTVLAVATVVFTSSLLLDSVLSASLVLCIGFGIVAYSIHRYELVRLGLVEPNP